MLNLRYKSIAIQRGNAVSLLGMFPVDRDADELFISFDHVPPFLFTCTYYYINTYVNNNQYIYLFSSPYRFGRSSFGKIYTVLLCIIVKKKIKVLPFYETLKIKSKHNKFLLYGSTVKNSHFLKSQT